jgi:hypothetical protein
MAIAENMSVALTFTLEFMHKMRFGDHEIA